ncbi:Stp1/IreP family PP2C-type Ser/Thr phosphatase [Bacillus sp. CGMCC 1.16607]|uniref:Stp1/IreP family PP2C-type Ser/Thr phosphatase n=1 Tax=Bacillus sp. CGMCC 1.16607 TaxID=3351842 RepID=UPI003632445E
MKAVFKTDPGRVRLHNEDHGGIFVNGENNRLAIVADGMGGHRAGDVASNMTINFLQKAWEESENIQTADQAEEWLKLKINEVNSELFQHAISHSECEGMGTTIIAAICTNHFVTLAHIGDSRCYLLNESGYKQLTEDHSLVNELVRSGQISKEDAENHPRKNVILRALGTEKTVEMDIITVIFEEGDILLLCSDGLSNKVSEKEMLDILSKKEEHEMRAESLIQLANHYGGEDNITLVIVEHSIGEEVDELL